MKTPLLFVATPSFTLLFRNWMNATFSIWNRSPSRIRPRLRTPSLLDLLVRASLNTKTGTETIASQPQISSEIGCSR
jgi:hypothetical protein